MLYYKEENGIVRFSNEVGSGKNRSSCYPLTDSDYDDIWVALVYLRKYATNQTIVMAALSFSQYAPCIVLLDIISFGENNEED
ncbi:Hypothetical predicted protein [Octopus vulgaris]|uniref:Uncharacterized protein n=1 Tax=Octopus vulgaris TaxID=6645 RepID=A0AA36EZE3_OCTVU|nr:Hypothetical predicted protein [Octopus vulgaris]